MKTLSHCFILRCKVISVQMDSPNESRQVLLGPVYVFLPLHLLAHVERRQDPAQEQEGVGVDQRRSKNCSPGFISNLHE